MHTQYTCRLALQKVLVETCLFSKKLLIAMKVSSTRHYLNMLAHFDVGPLTPSHTNALARSHLLISTLCNNANTDTCSHLHLLDKQTVAPILSIGSASLVAISTLTSEINFYTRLIQMVDPGTDRPLFAIRCIELCGERCKEEGKQAECVHMLHLVPMWQSEERHRNLKIMMQDRPDLIQSELSGLAFDSLQQVFRKPDIAIAVSLVPLPCPDNPIVFIVIDPAAGGPQSDYAIVSIIRSRGCITVSHVSVSLKRKRSCRAYFFVSLARLPSWTALVPYQYSKEERKEQESLYATCAEYQWHVIRMCVCARVCACVRVCLRVCVCVCARVYIYH